VQELVHLLGGTIRVESQAGKGTAFTVSLPFGTAHLPKDRIMHPKERHGESSLVAAYVVEGMQWVSEGDRDAGKPGAAASPAPAEGADTARILFADDNADMREHVRRILGAHWRVDTAADGQEALRLALENPPDLILSDIMMPGVGGLELVQSLRREARTRSIPIVLISARAGVEASAEGLTSGADDYIVKPFSTKDLVARVAAQLRLSGLRKAAEAEARSSLERLLEANKLEMVGRLAAGIAHDFNNLLTTILGYADLALESNRPGDVMQYLKEIKAAGAQAAETARLLLAYGRKQMHRPEVLSLKELVEGFRPALEKVLKPGIRLSVWQEAGAGALPICADRFQVGQALLNLAVNAVEAMPEGGELTIETRRAAGPTDDATGDWEAEGPECARLSVRDTGIGIAPEDSNRIFDPYFTSKGVGNIKGQGLGLASVQGIVRQNHGQIRVRSELGKGAVFDICFPLASSGGCSSP
jgi:signal transduction histidine kinase